MAHKYFYAYQRAIDRPPLRNRAIARALDSCVWMDDRLTLSWTYFQPHHRALWNHYSPPMEWLIEVIRWVNRYIRESEYHS